MDLKRMRRIDKHLGIPACAVLTLIRKVFGRAHPRQGVRPKRIVFVKLAEQGSTVLAYSAICRAVEKVGPENVFFLVFDQNRFILDAMEVIPADNVICIASRSAHSAVVGAIRAIGRMRRERIDTAIDLEFFARSSAALAFLSGATWRVGFHPFAAEASYRGDLMTHRVSFNPLLHASQTFRILVDALGIPPEKLPTFNQAVPALDQPLPEFRPRAGEVDEVKAILRRESQRDAISPLVLLNANCSDLLPLRRWPAQRYVELARRLIDRYPDMWIGFTGAPEAAPETEELVRKVGSDRCLCLAGRTTLRQLLVLYCLADVLVTNDSGPAHFATLAPIQVLSMFGPESPVLFAARSGRNHVLFSGIACSPCINAYNDRKSSCRDNVCMQNISVEQVFEKVHNLVESFR